jgi:hypothetical protein
LFTNLDEHCSFLLAECNIGNDLDRTWGHSTEPTQATHRPRCSEYGSQHQQKRNRDLRKPTRRRSGDRLSGLRSGKSLSGERGCIKKQRARETYSSHQCAHNAPSSLLGLRHFVTRHLVTRAALDVTSTS